MSSKNNPKNRQAFDTYRKYNGKTVKPVYYIGKHKGHGNYIAAMDEAGNMVLDPSTKAPIPYQKI